VDLVVLSSEGPLANQVPPGVELVLLSSPSIRLVGALKWRARRNQINAAVPALARYLRQRRPHVLMSAANHVHMSAAWAHRLARVPVPLVLRVSNHLTRSHLGEGRRQRPWRLRLARHLYGWADAVIAVADGIAEDISEHTRVPRESIFTIYNPTFTPDLPVKAAAPLDHPWFAPGEPPVLLGAGRFTPAKDFYTLLKAFARVRTLRPARLIILGEGKQHADVAALAHRLGVAEDMELPGFIDNPFPWMARANVFVLSSVWEGFPGVLIEAMACGCPVVSTDCPSGPVEILDRGAYGRLVPPRDDEALALAIQATLDAPPERSRLRMRAAEFSVDRAIDKYLQVLLGS
jgi:glycosyltransferase involved in cell wall biosynthesis